VAESQVKLYYKNVTAEIIGDEHGISGAQLKKYLKDLPQKIKELRSFPKLRKKEDAYRKLPHDAEVAQKIEGLVAQFKDRCENLVVLGIGGSALGNIALQTALNPYMHNLDDAQRPGPRLFVFDNIDPPQLVSFLGWIDEKLDKTIFNVISKSGRTAETASQFMIIRKLLSDKLGPDGCKNQVVATTDPQKGTLRKITIEDKLRCLEVPQGVGGRFSVLSAVGLFSAAMCGIDIDSLLAGARDMDERVSCEDFYKTPAAINAAINYLFTFLQVNNFDKDLKTGPAPDCAPELGFLAGKSLGTLFNNEKRATEYALLESKRPCLTVIFPQVSAYTVGQFIYLYEVTTSFAGALFGINPYDQPAVKLGKEATFALMEKPGQCELVDMTYEKFAQQIRSLTELDGDFLV